MATATYWQRGETLDYTNATEATIIAGSVIALGDHIGIAGTTIAAGETGSVHMTGVFKFPKTAAGAIAQGTAVYWDGDGIDSSAPSDEGAITSAIGYAAEESAAGATVIAVKLNG